MRDCVTAAEESLVTCVLSFDVPPTREASGRRLARRQDESLQEAGGNAHCGSGEETQQLAGGEECWTSATLTLRKKARRTFR